MKEHRIYVNAKWITEENCLNFDDWKEYEIENGTLHPDSEIWIADCEREGLVFSLQGFQDAFNEGLISRKIDMYITNKY